jgi:cytochrome P450
VLAELRRVVGGRAPKYDDLPQLQYTQQVVKEVLRLYPAIPLFPREVEKDDVLPTGHKIPAGDVSRQTASDLQLLRCSPISRSPA